MLIHRIMRRNPKREFLNLILEIFHLEVENYMQQVVKQNEEDLLLINKQVTTI